MGMEPQRSTAGWSVLLLVVALLAAGLWVSWRNGWFPFGAFSNPFQKSGPTPQQVIDSLSATTSTMTAEEANAPSKTLSSLSAPANPVATTTQVSQGKSVVNTTTQPSTTASPSALDSLTPKK